MSAQTSGGLLSKFFEEPNKSERNFFFAFALTRKDGSVIDFTEVQKHMSIAVEQRNETWEKWKSTGGI